VPWIALGAVTIFALVQVSARHDAEQRAEDAQRTPHEVPAPETSDAREAARAAERSLDQALLDLRAAEEREAAARRELHDALLRLEAAEAALSVAEARIEVLARPPEAPSEELDALRRELEAAHQRLEAARTEAARAAVLEWLDDAASDDASRRKRATERAARAGEAEVAAVRDALDADPGRATAAARLVAAMPPGEPADALAIALLLAPEAAGEAPDRVSAVGAAHLARMDVVIPLLRSAAPAVRREVLVWIAARDVDWSEADRTRVASALLSVLEAEDADALASAAHGLGIFRLGGGAGRLGGLLLHDAAAVRAASAYALARVPDAAAADESARAAVLRLLADEAVEVRTAAVLLAERLLGAPVDFDPAGDAASRAAALERIRTDLGS
jgi:hypothetical protein